ncbi:MAG: molybdopterin synthase catalytic subunit [Acidimicrobiales bacterium]
MESFPQRDWIVVSPSPLSANDLTSWATSPRCGAVVTFCGTVRATSGEHQDVTALEYETDASLAERAIKEIVIAARERRSTIEAIAIHHRVRRVELTDVAVVVAVSSAHRGEAFEAAQYCIDTLKDCVPVWKREVWPGGSAWSRDARPLQRVSPGVSAKPVARDESKGATS